MVKVLNTIHEDYHIHSLNYSDGLNTIDEIVQYAGKIGLKKIVITDHSQASLDINKFAFKNWRSTIKRWKNVHNDVEVSFGVEWDLLDEEWNCCFTIDWRESDFCILSLHYKVYTGSKENLIKAYSNAIEKYHEKIKFIWHPCLSGTPDDFDVVEFAKILNRYQIPIELNCSYLNMNWIDIEKFNKLMDLVEAWVYVNSDLHVLNDFNLRQAGFDYLEQKGFI